MDVPWIHGSRDGGDPAIQVHSYDEHSHVLRQSKDATFEAPFMFLLFGNDRAILFDTGATRDDSVRVAVDELVTQWLRSHPRDQYELVVAHTHGHGDHVAGDASFEGRPNTVIVGRELAQVTGHFGFTAWPGQVTAYDLGGRVLDVVGVPGHHATSIAVFDPWTGWLLTGDSIYPGRLYIKDIEASLDSFERLAEFASERPVTHVLGCHIEMNQATGRDYSPGCRYQPDEPPLQLTVEQLQQICAEAVALGGRPGVHRLTDAILYNGMGFSAMMRLNARGLVQQVRSRVARRAG